MKKRCLCPLEERVHIRSDVRLCADCASVIDMVRDLLAAPLSPDDKPDTERRRWRCRLH